MYIMNTENKKDIFVDLMVKLNFFEKKAHVDRIDMNVYKKDGTRDMRYANREDYKKVTYSDEFNHSLNVCKYLVTQKQWTEIMGKDSIKSKFIGDNLPVTNVSRCEIDEFIKKLNVLTNKNYRLPKINEWLNFSEGKIINEETKKNDIYIVENKYERINDSMLIWNPQKLSNYLWSYEDVCRENNGIDTIFPVGMKLPNQFGIYDLLGNVYEICEENILTGGATCDNLCSTEKRKNPFDIRNTFKLEEIDSTYVGFRLVEDCEGKSNSEIIANNGLEFSKYYYFKYDVFEQDFRSVQFFATNNRRKNDKWTVREYHN